MLLVLLVTAAAAAASSTAPADVPSLTNNKTGLRGGGGGEGCNQETALCSMHVVIKLRSLKFNLHFGGMKGWCTACKGDLLVYVSSSL